MSDSTVALTFADKVQVAFRSDMLKTSETVAKGVSAAMDMATGKIENADDVSGLLNCGLFVEESNGKTTNVTGDGVIKWVTQSGQISVNRTVTGVSARADVGKLVYPTDNQTFTLTRPANGTPIGYVSEWITSTTCNIYLFSFTEAILYGLSGGGAQAIAAIGSIPSKALEGTSAITIASYLMSGHGKITGFSGTCVAKDAGAVAGSQTFTLSVDGNAVTGGSIVLTKDTAAGARVDSAACTANNEYHQGSVLLLKMSASGTGYTADKLSQYVFQIITETLPGA